MQYSQIVRGIFLSRPNRFVAQVKIGDREHTVHVKNTGRCRELLLPGTQVLLEYHPDARAQGRKTQYSLVAVYKNRGENLPRLLINMDSQAPNQAAREWLENGGFKASTGLQPQQIQREVTYGQSRFDLAFQAGGRPAFMEVKGVTLEKDGIAMFPDAPTQRGVKHLSELAHAAQHGFLAYILFVIQMKEIRSFCPNREMHEAFAQTLLQVSRENVKVLAYDCKVTETGFTIDQPVPVTFP
ncbi:MAG: DNA/RNA nuclease SfsA [Hungatella sp.]|nr:DNA/RNA nuclease SfsA [Hungatella sp.]